MPEDNNALSLEPHGRHEFKKAVRDLLEKQACSICCNPGCQQATRASSFDMKRSINIGTAAHIHGASPKGPRYDQKMTQAEREADTNGIWLCRNCGTLVDDDQSAFPPETLTAWKAKSLQGRHSKLALPSAQVASPGSALSQDSVAWNNDIARYSTFIKSFPSTNGVFFAMKQFDGGRYFERGAFNKLGRMLDKWTAPEEAFSNPVVQAALRSLTKAVNSFLDAIAYNTYPVERPPNYQGVPKEWRDRMDKERAYNDAVDILNDRADEVIQAYTTFIQTARMELKC